MKRSKWAVALRNKLSSLAIECDSAAAIEESKMSIPERTALKHRLMDVVDWIDKRIKIVG